MGALNSQLPKRPTSCRDGGGGGEGGGGRQRISSVAFPESNGRAEVAVKKAKRTVMDNISPTGALDNGGRLRAMLQLRNTPDPDCNVSPAEVVFGRPTRNAFSFVNICTKFENPSIRPMRRQRRMLRALNSRAGPKCPLVRPTAAGDRRESMSRTSVDPIRTNGTGQASLRM